MDGVIAALRTFAAMNSISKAQGGDAEVDAALATVANDLCCHLTLRVHMSAAETIASSPEQVSGTPRGGIKLHASDAMQQARWLAMAAPPLLLAESLRELAAEARGFAFVRATLIDEGGGLEDEDETLQKGTADELLRCIRHHILGHACLSICLSTLGDLDACVKAARRVRNAGEASSVLAESLALSSRLFDTAQRVPGTLFDPAGAGAGAAVVAWAHRAALESTSVCLVQFRSLG